MESTELICTKDTHLRETSTKSCVDRDGLFGILGDNWILKGYVSSELQVVAQKLTPASQTLSSVIVIFLKFVPRVMLCFTFGISEAKEKLLQN